MEELISELGLEEAVYIMGNLSNPFIFMKHCDCLVFPSNYEGHPLVVLEARIIGMPIIVSDFSAVRDVLLENGQLIIQKDIDSIYKGLKSFLEEEVPFNYNFDPDNYNKKSYREFEILFN